MDGRPGMTGTGRARRNVRAPRTALLRPLRIPVIAVPSSGRASPTQPAFSGQALLTVYPPRVGTFAGRPGTSGPCPRTRPGGRLDRVPAGKRKD